MSSPAEAKPIRLSSLPRTAATEVDLRPAAGPLEALRADLGLLGLRKVSLRGTLEPEGRTDWRLAATLGATVVQPCVVTLEPVTTRIDQPVERLYSAGFRFPAEAETEMPEDDTVEPLPEALDLMAVLRESLALALPDFPRADAAAFGGAETRPPGAAPIEDEAESPFAALSALKRDTET